MPIVKNKDKCNYDENKQRIRPCAHNNYGNKSSYRLQG